MTRLNYFIISNGLAIVLISISLYTDITSNKIKNIIIYPFGITGFILNFYHGGYKGGINSLYGVLLPIFTLMILYLIGAMGAGDLKLFAAIGGIMGRHFIIRTMTFSFLGGGVIALGLMVVRKNGRQRLQYLLNYMGLLFMTRKLETYSDLKCNMSGKFSFALAIFVGTMITIFLENHYIINDLNFR